MPQAYAWIDDIIFTGGSDHEHLDFRKRSSQEWKVQGQSSGWTPSVDWVEHGIDAKGVHPIRKKVYAVKDVPEPNNVSELRSFLGLVNYHSKYLANLASTRNLCLRKEILWSWRKG